MRTKLLTIEYFIEDGELKLNYEGIPPDTLKKALQEDQSLLGAWRVQDRLVSCVQALYRDWDAINS